MNIGIIVIIVITILVVVCIELIYHIKKSCNNNAISFYEGLHLANTPIVTLYCNKQPLNFVLDTGSSSCHITTDAMKLLDKEWYESNEASTKTLNANGEFTEQQSIVTILSYKNVEYKALLFVNKEFSIACQHIKDTEGVQIHGVLGCDFFTRYGYIIDYEEFIAYSKHNMKKPKVRKKKK